ncbi:MAG: hypothetical protein Q4E57_09765 [Eubacteriales bacterium]|nr:hypothetical protein [Eubacteriales bacterium]
MKKNFVNIMMICLAAGMLCACGGKNNAAETTAAAAAAETTAAETTEAQTGAEETTAAAEETKAADEKEAAAIMKELAGSYMQEFTEEIEGKEETFKYFILFNENGTGTWLGQDMFPFTWDAEKLIPDFGGDEYRLAFSNEDLMVIFPDDNNTVFVKEAAVSDECKAALEEAEKFGLAADANAAPLVTEAETVSISGKLVSPMPTVVVAGAIPDGTYPVTYKFSELKDQAGEPLVDMDFYEVEKYAAEDMEALKEGDGVEYNGNTVAVDSIDSTNGMVMVNGGIDEGGATFKLAEGEEYYTFFGWDDMMTYAHIGGCMLGFAKDLKVMDQTDPMNLAGTEITLSELQEKYSERADQRTATATVKDMEITELTLNYVP